MEINYSIMLATQTNTYLRSVRISWGWEFRKYNLGFSGGWMCGPVSYTWYRQQRMDEISKAKNQTNQELAS